jgi:hypothetical protein
MLERSVLGEEHFQMPLRLLINVTRNGRSDIRDVLAISRWEMLLKAVRQPLGTAKRVLESRWEIPKGY